MEKHPNPFDEFLKETLKGHQLFPREEARRAFLREAGTIIPSRKFWINWYIIPILVIFITGIITVLYLLNDNESAGTVNTNETVTPILTNEPVTTTTSTARETSLAKRAQPINNSKSEPINERVDITETGIPVSAEPEIPEPLTVSAGNTSSQALTMSSVTTSSRLDLDSLAQSGITKADTSVNSQAPVTSVTSPEPVPAGPAQGNPARDKYQEYYTAGVYYLPEWIFNTFEGDQFINNFGIEGAYHLGPFSVRTGAAFSINEGIYRIGVEYNDYLGSYDKLDSISFTFDEPTHDFIANYYMSSEKVWDTIPLIDYPEIIKRYTFFHIPVIFGYDFLQKERFSMGIRAGTTISFLIKSKQVSDDYNPGDNKVINVYKITPDYVNVNWQLTGGLNASVKLTRSILFEIEPVVNYYHSIYESHGTGETPFSAGIRTAILFKF